MRMIKIDYFQGVYACIGGDITEDPRRQTGAKINENSMFSWKVMKITTGKNIEEIIFFHILIQIVGIF